MSTKSNTPTLWLNWSRSFKSSSLNLFHYSSWETTHFIKFCYWIWYILMTWTNKYIMFSSKLFYFLRSKWYLRLYILFKYYLQKYFLNWIRICFSYCRNSSISKVVMSCLLLHWFLWASFRALFLLIRSTTSSIMWASTSVWICWRGGRWCRSFMVFSFANY